MKPIHGGDWAGYQAEYGTLPLDFSASVSPLGLPEGARRAAEEALLTADRYPDPLCRRLRAALAECHGVPAGQIVCGNGASDLIDRLCRALRPRKAAVLAPGFAEYSLALQAAGCAVTSLALKEAEDFRLTEETLHALPPDCDLLFLCNPNNPTGLLADRTLLRELLSRSRETGMVLAVDECFLELTELPRRESLAGELAQTPGLVILRAFTKSYAMAGLRLGYALCGSEALARRIQTCGQPWPVSSMAQAAGLAALGEEEYLQAVRTLVTAERRLMIPALGDLGLRVLPGEANFLLFFSENVRLAENLKPRGILIRDCRNFEGLGPGWYRIAVRTAEENSRLLRTLQEVM